MTLIKLTSIKDRKLLIDIRSIDSIQDNKDCREITLRTATSSHSYYVKETIDEIEAIQADLRSLRCFHFSLLG